jgi:hypothetical protein
MLHVPGLKTRVIGGVYAETNIKRQLKVAEKDIDVFVEIHYCKRLEIG